MPIIARVSHKTLSMRLLIALVYLLLGLGALTMTYPFLLMLVTSVTSYVDAEHHRFIPKYLYDDEMLFAKYLEIKYGVVRSRSVKTEDLRRIFEETTPIFRFEDVRPPLDIDCSSFGVENICNDWQEFKQTINNNNPGYIKVFFIGKVSPRPAVDNPGPATELYRKNLKRTFRKDIAEANTVLQTNAKSFSAILPPTERPYLRQWLAPVADPQYQHWLEWRKDLPSRYLTLVPIAPLYHEYLRTYYQPDDAHPRNIDTLNYYWNTDYEHFLEIPLSYTAPKKIGERDRWVYFVKHRLNIHYLRFNEGIDAAYQIFLKTLYRTGNDTTTDSIVLYNQQHHTTYSSFKDIRFPRDLIQVHGIERTDVLRFIQKPEAQGGCPPNLINLATPERFYHDFLRKKYGTLENVNNAYGAQYSSFNIIRLPTKLIDWIEVKSNGTKLRWYFLWRNYDVVFRFLAIHGRGLLNTAILCAGAVVFALTINPLCAYALSRYQMKAANKILIFLLATMAFPPSVSLIPSFLMLRDMNLLNSYWALLLPTAANGFTIFMMKGFFDTLPREIFEAAKIDGANELRIFFQIMVPLCKPVFAFFALGAFTSAYGGFFWAFTVCRDSSMWTLMVWLYELQTWQIFPVQMAALVLAAIPTLLIFTVVQNIILKGIVLPTYH